eukprot:jgi/Chlat1/8323/Chrsp8S00674
MAKGAAPSQSSTMGGRGAGVGSTPGPRATAPVGGRGAVAAGLRRRRAATGTATQGNMNSGNSGMLRFYTEDAPGLRISPPAVLIMSLLFIASVTILHVIGKLYNAKTA